MWGPSIGVGQGIGIYGRLISGITVPPNLLVDNVTPTANNLTDNSANRLTDN
jgi:hypothetical protein